MGMYDKKLMERVGSCKEDLGPEVVALDEGKQSRDSPLFVCWSSSQVLVIRYSFRENIGRLNNLGQR
jgi:hypothetical protein